MPNDDTGAKPGDANGKGQDQGEGTASALEKFVGKLDAISDRFDALDKKVNLIQSNVLSPEYLEGGGKDKGKGQPAPKDDKPEPQDFDSIDWDNMSNREVVHTLVTELNRVLKGAGEGMEGKVKELGEVIDELTTELDINSAIVQIARTEKCSMADAADKFFDLADELEELGKKFPTITALDAYKIATGQMKKPGKKDEKGEDRGGEDERLKRAQAIAAELKKGGGKPGGTTDLGTKTPKETRDVVSAKYDEIFPNG